MKAGDVMDDVNFTYADPADPLFKRKLIGLVERVSGQRALKRLYLDNRRRPTPGESFFAACVRQLALDVRYDAAAFAAIPCTGAMVFVSNHPYGVLDGIVLSHLVARVRGDFLVLTNAVLLRAPEIGAHVLPVDFAATPAAQAINIASRARARAHLAQGGALVVFPAGGVSTTPDRLGREPAIDAPWGPLAAQMIQRARATVVPVRFAGQNSRLFQLASHLSQTLRLSLIFHEVRRRIGTRVDVGIGAPIPFADLKGLDRQALTDRLRATVDALPTPSDA